MLAGRHRNYCAVRTGGFTGVLHWGFQQLAVAIQLISGARKILVDDEANVRTVLGFLFPLLPCVVQPAEPTVNHLWPLFNRFLFL